MTWLAGGHAHSAAAASTGHRTRLRLHPARLPAPDAMAPGPRTAEPGVSPDGTRWPVPCARGRGSPATCHCRVIPASVQVQRPVSTPRPGPCQTRRAFSSRREGGRDRGQGRETPVGGRAPPSPSPIRPPAGPSSPSPTWARRPRRREKPPLPGLPATRPRSLCPWLRVSQPGAHYLPVPLPLVRDGDPRPSPAPSPGLPVAHPPPAPAS